MKKTDKKRDNQIRDILTDICEEALDLYPGFEWLTHRVNFSAFPKSLKVICVFDTNANLKAFMQSHQAQLNKNIKNAFAKVDINLQDMGRHVKYDTEEQCEQDNTGDWGERLSTSV